MRGHNGTPMRSRRCSYTRATHRSAVTSYEVIERYGRELTFVSSVTIAAFTLLSDELPIVVNSLHICFQESDSMCIRNQHIRKGAAKSPNHRGLSLVWALKMPDAGQKIRNVDALTVVAIENILGRIAED